MSHDPRDAQLKQYEHICRDAVRRLVPLARSVCGVVLDPEDLMIEAQWAVVEALQVYGGGEMPEQVWVKTRIKQRLLDAIRRFNLRSRIEVSRIRENPEESLVTRRQVISIEEVGATLSNTEKPDEYVWWRGEVDDLLAALETLPPRQRHAIEQGYLRERRLVDIANEMNISESRVCQLQKKGISNLRKLLKREDGDQ